MKAKRFIFDKARTASLNGLKTKNNLMNSLTKLSNFQHRRCLKAEKIKAKVYVLNKHEILLHITTDMHGYDFPCVFFMNVKNI